MRQKGVDAWLDRWEIKPGDSLIDKIFEEGIKNADVFIVILSENSVSKPWVREELDAGMVKKIEKNCRLIPIVLDNCSVPSTLKHLLWVKITDLSNYEKELTQIVNTVHGTTEKPALGSKPKHAEKPFISYLPQLTNIDNIVFGVLCNIFLNSGETFFEAEPVYKELRNQDLTDEEVSESLEILESRGIISVEWGHDRQIYAVKMPVSSIDVFLKNVLPDYEQKIITIVSKIVNENSSTNVDIHQQTNIELHLVSHFLNLLELNSLIVLGKSMNGTYYISSVSAELKRMLRA